MTGIPSDLVLDSELETEFFDECVLHTRYIPGKSSRARLIRVEEIWDIRRELGRGAFGSVRCERLRPTSLPRDSQSSPSTVRAVKVISKASTSENATDYIQELQAVFKFSQPRYRACFVQAYGWFQDAKSVFIAMEYFPLGDLQARMKNSPPFGEEVTRQIVRQLLDGASLMHRNSYAHRDLKPANILVESMSPEWLVKIADLGVSKLAREGETQLRTNIGTRNYMAPEVLGFDPFKAYSVAVDIWAIGIIAFELLLKCHPFVDRSIDYRRYIHGSGEGDLDRFLANKGLSPSCRHFLRELLAPEAANRPTAVVARNHPWLNEDEVISIMDTDDELFVPESPREDTHMETIIAATPASLQWSNLRPAANSPLPTQSSVSLLTTHQGPYLDASILLPNFQHIPLETSRYFILRSTNWQDIETSAAHGVWTSGKKVNARLNKGYQRSGGRVILLFSIIKSRKFCGVAEMTSAMDWDNTDEHWLDDFWKGRFTLRWLSVDELSFDRAKHIPVSARTPGFRAVACYDGTEISALSAFELLKAYST